MLAGRLKSAEVNYIKNKRLRVEKLQLRTPQSRIDDSRQKLDTLLKQAEQSFKLKLSEKTKIMSQLAAKLDALSPLSVLGRGYSIAENADGNVIRSVRELSVDTDFSLHLADGECNCTVKENKYV